MAKRKAQGIVVRNAAAPKAGATPQQAAKTVATAAPAVAPAAPAEEEPPEEAEPVQEESVGHVRRKKRRRLVAQQASAAALEGAVAPGTSEDSSPEPPQGPLAPSGAKLTPTEVLAWLLWPVSPATFFAEYWEKKPLHVRRGRPLYYEGLLSKADLDALLRKDGAEFKYGERINLSRLDKACGKVSLNAGERGTAVRPSEVDAAWGNGATIQVMHPQQYHEPVWRLLAALERSFAALFGANAYLTPAGCQGLAPHYDDVEVVMLQLEGSKRWHLHAPPAGEEYPLARAYSRDFAREELGQQLLECTLEPGDLLYLPRGTVHFGITEGQASGGSFSHHLTVSTYQKMAWSHFLERALSGALERAATESPEYRAGLPVGFLGYMGSWHDGIGGSMEALNGRAAFARKLRGLIGRLQDFLDADEVCDELGVDFTSQRLPPAIGRGTSAASGAAAAASVDLGGSKTNGANGTPSTVGPDTRVRWLEPSAVRPMLSTDPETLEATVMLFHPFANTQGQHMCKAVEVEEDVGCLRFEAAIFLPAIRALCGVGSDFLRVSDLPLADEGDKVALCENLHEAGLLELAPAMV